MTTSNVRAASIRSRRARLMAAALLLPLLTTIARADDRSALVGTWRIVEFQDDGRDRLGRLGAAPARKGKPPRTAYLVFTKSECRVLRGDGKREMRAGLANAAWKSVTLDPATDPKSIDIVGFAGKDGSRTKTYPGLYALDGKSLTICWNEQGKQRPAKLESDGSNNLFVCEKVSDEPREPLEDGKAGGR